MLVVLHLDGSIDPHSHRHLLRLLPVSPNDQRGQLLRLKSLFQADQVVGLCSGDAQTRRRSAILELTREDSHADQIASMNPLEAPGDHCANAEKCSALRGPVARASRPVFVPREHHQRHPLLAIADRSIVDAHLLAAWMMDRDAPFHARNHLVLDADIREGSTRHDLVVATAGAVAVEVFDLYALIEEILS